MRRISARVFPVLCLALVAGCGQVDAPGEAASEERHAKKAQVVEIVARGLQFEAPGKTTAGWNTFRLRNESAMVHFALVQRLPGAMGVEEHQRSVAPVFQEGMDLLNAGDPDAAMQAFGKLPEWFKQIVFYGGPGLVAGGGTTATTIYLEPGTYLIECYVKTGGRFHSASPAEGVHGMVAELEVIEPIGPDMPPAATHEIVLSAQDGIQSGGNLPAGPTTVKVTFADQQPHENFVGHDLHLARVNGDIDMDNLLTWMDWRNKTGLETPAPVQFVGGINEMPAGSAGYLHLDLTPGEYLWIAEVPGAQAKGMAKRFTVPGTD